MTAIRAFIHSHPVLIYYAVTFALSWGGFLVVGARGLIEGTSWQIDPLFPFAVLAMLAGPPVAGILLTGLVLRYLPDGSSRRFRGLDGEESRCRVGE